MDPTTLTPEEQIARYDEIIALVAEEPADDAGKIGQFVQIAGIVNRAAEEAAPEEAPVEEPAPEPAARAKGGNPHAAAIAASKEGQANPAGALQAIAAGLTLAQFKAMAPSLGKGASLAGKMAQQPGAQRLGADAVTKPGAKVVPMPTSQDSFARRREAIAAGRK